MVAFVSCKSLGRAGLDGRRFSARRCGFLPSPVFPLFSFFMLTYVPMTRYAWLARLASPLSLTSARCGATAFGGSFDWDIKLFMKAHSKHSLGS